MRLSEPPVLSLSFKSSKILSPTSVEIAKWQGDGYSRINPVYKERLNFKLDGKDYTPTGPRVAKGTTVSASKNDDHNIELTYKLKGQDDRNR